MTVPSCVITSARWTATYINLNNQHRNPRGKGQAMTTEPKNTGKFGKGNPGKPKGALSKTTKAAKEAIELAAEGLGGASRLIDWCKEDTKNESAFWTSIYPKLLPLQVTGEGGGPILVGWLDGDSN